MAKAGNLSVSPYKGTRDFYPPEMRFRQWMFGQMREAVSLFGFEEYDGPMLESFDIYAAKTGEEIVKNQLYWLTDKGERKLAIRPEMTPTLARMVAGKLMELPKPIRWFSMPNLWRYERPQRGRLREHWQLNVDILGGDDPQAAEAEILGLTLSLVERFGGLEHVKIRFNHREVVNRFFQGKLGFSQDQSQTVMKLLDARGKMGEEKFAQAVGEAGVGEAQLKQILDFLQMDAPAVEKLVGMENIAAVIKKVTDYGYPTSALVFDPSIMRGLDYYTGIVFEMFDNSPENNRAIFGGGRYDGLVGLFGKQQLGGVGFGLGDVTFQHFLETHKLVPDLGSGKDLFVTMNEGGRSECLELAKRLREMGLRVVTPLADAKLGTQLKTADKLGVPFALIVDKDQMQLKALATGDQNSVKLDEIPGKIRGK